MGANEQQDQLNMADFAGGPSVASVAQQRDAAVRDRDSALVELIGEVTELVRTLRRLVEAELDEAR